MQLPLEAIEEFNISTQRFSAANGRSEGAAVNVITKCGTNHFHGSLFFQDRDQAFDSSELLRAGRARRHWPEGALQPAAVRRIDRRTGQEGQDVPVFRH